MANALTNVTFTAAEKRTLTASAAALDSIASRCGRSAYMLLVETYSAETTGPSKVTRHLAVGFICDWFLRTYDNGAMPLRDYIGTRSLKVAMIADDARHNDRARASELEAIREGVKAKEAAIMRARS